MKTVTINEYATVNKTESIEVLCGFMVMVSCDEDEITENRNISKDIATTNYINWLILSG